MQITNFIFSVYLIILAIFPAIEEWQPFPGTQSTLCCSHSCESASETGDSSETEDRGSQSCNPFQTCDCCVSVKSEADALSVSSTVVRTKIGSTLKEKIPLQMGTGFWQPPRQG